MGNADKSLLFYQLFSIRNKETRQENWFKNDTERASKPTSIINTHCWKP